MILYKYVILFSCLMNCLMPWDIYRFVGLYFQSLTWTWKARVFTSLERRYFHPSATPKSTPNKPMGNKRYEMVTLCGGGTERFCKRHQFIVEVGDCWLCQVKSRIKEKVFNGCLKGSGESKKLRIVGFFVEILRLCSIRLWHFGKW